MRAPRLFSSCAVILAALVGGPMDAGGAQGIGAILNDGLGSRDRLAPAPPDGSAARGGPSPRSWPPGLYEPYAPPLGNTRLLSSAEIVRALRARGYRDLELLRRAGGTVLFDATGAKNIRIRLVVDGRSADIIGAKVLNGRTSD